MNLFSLSEKILGVSFRKRKTRHLKKKQTQLVFALLPPRQGEHGQYRGLWFFSLETLHAGAGWRLGFELTIAEHVTLLQAGAWPYIVKFLLIKS